MNNIILCESCGCSGRAVQAMLTDDSEYPLFFHLGHDAYTGDMHFRCANCGALLLVDPMQMITRQFVRGIASGLGSPASGIDQKVNDLFCKSACKSTHP